MSNEELFFLYHHTRLDYFILSVLYCIMYIYIYDVVYRRRGLSSAGEERKEFKKIIKIV